MTSASVPSGVHERGSKNTTKWLLGFIVFLTCCIFAHFILLVKSTTVPTLDGTGIFRNYEKGRREREAAEELEFWVHKYVRWHRANRHNASRVAVYLGVRGGLGDNVKGMLSMWGYAVTTGRLFLLGMTHSPYPLAEMVSESAAHEFYYNTQEDRKFGRIQGGSISVPGRLMSDAAPLMKGPTPAVGLHVAAGDRPDEFALRPPRYEYPSVIPKFSLDVQKAITRILLEPSDHLLKLKNEFLSAHGLNEGDPYFAYHARLGRGIREHRDRRFRNINYTFVSECAADKLIRIAERYRMKSRVLRIFLATDTPDYRTIFEKTMLKKAPNARVVYMKKEPRHYAGARNYSAQVQIQLENILIGDAKEIIAYWSGFSNVALWRGKAIKLHEMYYRSCPK